MFDYSKLRGKIREICFTERNFADELGVNRATLSLKLGNKVQFTANEIVKSCRILEIPLEDVHEYFFAINVGKTQ